MLMAGSLPAHPAYLTDARVTIASDGELRLSMRFDTLAFALNDTSARIGNAPMEALLDGPREELEARLTEARDRFVHGLSVSTDHGPWAVKQVDFPMAAAVLSWRDTNRPVLPVLGEVRLEGKLPFGATSVSFRFPAVLDQVILTVERPGEEPSIEPVAANAASAPLPVKLLAEDAFRR